ncbi:4-phosphopantetheinyl transferase [Aquimarina sp. BL5]|uniref:4'-phosphopantetheinyl transferase family protein n=1 Tax=Aquimarina sp. BL5 TaxID=1714860 RepID=UPI000E4F7B44|nr:4'-phosphopantetheinyl transferase superfamily protein [Aquimarina sp. BL5]AXT51929.1 4-phosphopantetheinyl transferase [Aquimarina sp. BL5]RKM93417.1 4'-phosphopantetheinyl transferase superfamily protein [Aquimarina sp. BL5]
MILILYTEIYKSSHNSILDTYLQSLPLEMQQKAKAYIRWQDQQASILGKLLVKNGFEIFNSIKDPLMHIEQNSYGRPFVKGELDFNISHSGKYVICVFSDMHKVGIDIEEMKPIDYLDFKSQMCDEEWNRLLLSNNKMDEFYKYWTSKEAVIKAIGKGLSIPLKSFIINNNETSMEQDFWFLTPLKIDKTYRCHLALNKKISKEKMIIVRKDFPQL